MPSWERFVNGKFSIWMKGMKNNNNDLMIMDLSNKFMIALQECWHDLEAIALFIQCKLMTHYKKSKIVIIVNRVFPIFAKRRNMWIINYIKWSEINIAIWSRAFNIITKNKRITKGMFIITVKTFPINILATHSFLQLCWYSVLIAQVTVATLSSKGCSTKLPLS